MPPVSPVLLWMFRLQDQVSLSAYLLGYCSHVGRQMAVWVCPEKWRLWSGTPRCPGGALERRVWTWFWGRCCSVPGSCLTLCDPVACSTPGFPVLHYRSECVQTHVRWVSNAIQPSCPLLPTSLPSVFPSIRVFSFLFRSSTSKSTNAYSVLAVGQALQETGYSCYL